MILLILKTFTELDALELISTNSDAEDDVPPLPLRSSSCTSDTMNNRSLPPLPTLTHSLEKVPEPSDDESDSNSSSDAIILDTSESDSDDDDDDNDNNVIMNNGENFNADATLPPIPNGTFNLDPNSPDKQMSSSDDEK